MRDCDGEIATIGITTIDAPIGAGLTYKEQCINCKRWCGKGSLSNGFNGAWQWAPSKDKFHLIWQCTVSIDAIP